MRFKIIPGSTCEGVLRYVPEEYSFRFESTALPESITSVQLNSLQLAVNECGEVLYPWGYCPLLKCKRMEITTPSAFAGKLVIDDDLDLMPGVSLALTGPAEWPLLINSSTRWVCIGDPEVVESESVEFASNCIAVLQYGVLKTVWLRPEHLTQAT